MQNRCFVYTIGHSTHPIDRFIDLLRRHDVTALADVRSTPYSRFNRESLAASLTTAGVDYVFLGEELGARSRDPDVYRHGKVQYDLLARTDLFRRGLVRVKTGAREHRIALMCAEKDPLDCHRTILVARHLAEQGISVRHILADGGVESHEEALDRLVRTVGPTTADLFHTRAEAIRDAYEKRSEAIAYSLPKPKGHPGNEKHGRKGSR